MLASTKKNQEGGSVGVRANAGSTQGAKRTVDDRRCRDEWGDTNIVMLSSADETCK